MYGNEDVTGRGAENPDHLEGNLVEQGGVTGQGDPEENADRFESEPQHITTNDLPPKPLDDNSFHMDEYFEKVHQNPKFLENEQKINERLDKFFRAKTGKSISNFTGYIFLLNKILMITTLFEFLFQRFNIITLFLSIVILLIELEIFTYKHIYKWLLILLCSLLLDALVLLDITPVSLNIFLLL
jgi:hypothetical protein